MLKLQLVCKMEIRLNNIYLKRHVLIPFCRDKRYLGQSTLTNILKFA